VVAGVGGPDDPIGAVDPDAFCDTLLLNTLAPLRIIDRLADRVTDARARSLPHYKSEQINACSSIC